MTNWHLQQVKIGCRTADKFHVYHCKTCGQDKVYINNVSACSILMQEHNLEPIVINKTVCGGESQ